MSVFKRFIGHFGAPSAFELFIVLCLLAMVAAATAR